MTFPATLERYGFSPRVVLPSGDGSSGIAVVGEAPGQMEDSTGLPFHPHADAGSQLERILRLGGWSRDTLTLTNACWQRPLDNRLEGESWEAEALATWSPHLEEALSKAKVVVAMGNIPLKALCPDYGGEGKSITAVSQYKLRSRWGHWVIPTYHPAFIMRGQQKLIGASLFAFSEAFKIAREGFSYEEPSFLLDPLLDQFEAWARDYNPERHFLNYDIETPRSGKLDEEDLEEDPSYQIIRASLSYEGDRVVSFPWQEPYRSVALGLLASLGPKRVWNNGFDNPRLRADGCQLNGRLYDAMELWSHLQRTLPRSLGFVTPFFNWKLPPWKHESSAQPSYYSACDALALHLCGEGIERDLRASGRWANAERHVVDCYEVLSLMSKTGLPYDREKALEKEKEFQALKDERELLLQSLVPESVKPSKQTSGYKKVPKITEALTRRKFRVKVEKLSKAEITALAEEGKDLPPTVQIERWCKLKPFNPQSFRQLIALIKAYGLTPAKNHKTKEETSEDDSLKKIIKKCEKGSLKEKELAKTLKLCRETRQLGKVLGTYLRGWKVGNDGRIHSTPGFWGDMYRVSWRRPNIAATIADKEEEQLASGFRECVAASEGRVLVEADWKGMESLLVAYFASDQDYERLSRLGIHDYLCSHLLVTRKKLTPSQLPSLSWPDSQLKKFFKWIKETYPKDRDDAKHTVHGQNYGMGPFLMAEMYEMPLKEAKALQALYFQLFPKIQRWQETTLQRAHKEHKLKNPFGYTCWFWDVLKWNNDNQKHDLGKDAKSAISFLPRDTGAAMLKEVLLRLEEKHQFASRGIMLASTHDSILCECPEEQLDEVAMILKEEMEAPVPELNNLVIGVDVAYGRWWVKDPKSPYCMKEWKDGRSEANHLGRDLNGVSNNLGDTYVALPRSLPDRVAGV